MRGGAQAHLMRAADGFFYVVKFRNNPQHLRVLANELLAARLAEAVGLPVAAAGTSGAGPPTNDPAIRDFRPYSGHRAKWSHQWRRRIDHGNVALAWRDSTRPTRHLHH